MKKVPLVLLGLLISALALSVAQAGSRPQADIDRGEYISEILGANEERALIFLDAAGNTLLSQEEFTQQHYLKL